MTLIWHGEAWKVDYFIYIALLNHFHFNFFGTPNSGSSLGEESKRVVSPKIRKALKPHPTESLNLENAFQKLDIRVKRVMNL